MTYAEPDSFGQVCTREMTRNDIAAALRLCRLSGWNQVEQDWSLFLELSPNGCRVAEKNDRVIGTVVTLRYQDRFSWIAMMLVDPQERRNGIGTRLVREGLAILSDQASVRLDATPAGRQLYRLEGFKDEYLLARMTFNPKSTFFPEGSQTVRPMSESDFPTVLQLDHHVFGADREPLLRNLFRRAPEYAWVSEASGIEGYCFGRPGYLTEDIGPIIATREEIARELLSNLLVNQKGKSFLIDTPRRSSWFDWLRSKDFVEARSFVRMYWGENPYPGRPEYLFGVVGPEFG